MAFDRSKQRANRKKKRRLYEYTKEVLDKQDREETLESNFPDHTTITGVKDPTPYEAISNILREERAVNE